MAVQRKRSVKEITGRLINWVIVRPMVFKLAAAALVWLAPNDICDDIEGEEVDEKPKWWLAAFLMILKPEKIAEWCMRFIVACAESWRKYKKGDKKPH